LFENADHGYVQSRRPQISGFLLSIRMLFSFLTLHQMVCAGLLKLLMLAIAMRREEAVTQSF
jgi:hypothetical protein